MYCLLLSFWEKKSQYERLEYPEVAFLSKNEDTYISPLAQVDRCMRFNFQANRPIDIKI